MDNEKSKQEKDGWKDIGLKIEKQIKEEVKRVTDSAKSTDWKETGKNIDAKIRAQMAKAVGAQPDADWAPELALTGEVQSDHLR